MKRLVCTLVAVILGSLSPLVAGSPQDPTDADYDWVGSVERRAFDALMPLDLGAGQAVAYRSYHDFMSLGEIERHFTIRYQGPGFNPNHLSASVVAPVGRSIQRQLLDLHMADRAARFEAILAKIAVSRWLVDSSSCPAVLRQMRALSDVDIKVPAGGRFVSHPIYHRLVVRVSTLTIDVTDEDETSPLVRWAIQTTDDLVACGHRQELSSAVR